jgi:hypothetical protein
MKVDTTPVEVREKVAQDPMMGVHWDKVADAVGIEVAVVVEETCGMVSDFSRRVVAERNQAETRPQRD